MSVVASQQFINCSFFCCLFCCTIISTKSWVHKIPFPIIIYFVPRMWLVTFAIFVIAKNYLAINAYIVHKKFECTSKPFTHCFAVDKSTICRPYVKLSCRILTFKTVCNIVRQQLICFFNLIYKNLFIIFIFFGICCIFCKSCCCACIDLSCILVYFVVKSRFCIFNLRTFKPIKIISRSTAIDICYKFAIFLIQTN